MHSNDVRLAILEKEMRDMKDGMERANKTLDDISDTLASMSGGKKAVFAMFTVVGAVIAAVGVIITTVVNLWHRVG